MSQFHVVEVPTPRSLDDPYAWVAQADRAMWSRESIRLTGADDENETLVSFTTRVADTADGFVRFLVALPADKSVADVTSPDEVLGVVEAEFPTTDNTSNCFMALIVREDVRRGGIGKALHDATLRIVREEGRGSILTWLDVPHEVAPDTPGGIPAKSGTGIIDGALPSAAFASARGYELEQVERCSHLALPVSDEGLRLGDDALAKAGPDYALIPLGDACPADLLDAYCGLRVGMSIDIPDAGLDFTDEVWSPERIRRQEARMAEAGKHALGIFARHLPTGELAGYTQLVRADEKPRIAYQWDTYVAGAHRGHALGMAMKVANLRQAAAAWPEAEHISTWNAQENEHMLAINVALGFRPFSVSAAWQLRLP